MIDVRTARWGHLEWAIAGRPAPGEVSSGDAATVRQDRELSLLALVDGLGHGPSASRAAFRAIQAIEDHSDQPLATLLQTTHRVLQHGRGATATVATIDEPRGLLTWLGVGNVEGVLVRRDDEVRPRTHGVLLRGGVLGQQLPALQNPAPLQLADGDCIAMATDGVRTDLAEAARSRLAVDRLARRLLDEHAVPTDDALVLVARYLAEPVGGTE